MEVKNIETISNTNGSEPFSDQTPRKVVGSHKFLKILNNIGSRSDENRLIDESRNVNKIQGFSRKKNVSKGKVSRLQTKDIARDLELLQNTIADGTRSGKIKSSKRKKKAPFRFSAHIAFEVPNTSCSDSDSQSNSSINSNDEVNIDNYIRDHV